MSVHVPRKPRFPDMVIWSAGLANRPQQRGPQQLIAHRLCEVEAEAGFDAEPLGVTLAR
jgi:hypothetical protein